jgi:UDP-N-acetylmuramyl tripeptide synthase
VASIGRDRGTLWFGIDDPGAALPALPHAADSKWCVRCGERLHYDAVYLGHLGAWRCPGCGERRPALDIVARDIQPEGLIAVRFRLQTPVGEEQVRLPMPGIYNVYNALAAAALAVHSAGVTAERIRTGLERFSAAFGRFERIELAGRPAVLLLIKNPAGTNEVIRTLAHDPSRKTLLLALNDRIADGRDVSWIWDVDFELMTEQVHQVVVTGTRAAEMGMRLKYAGVDPAVIEVARPDDALDLVGGRGEGPVYLLATYTAMLDLRRRLAERGIVKPFWEEAA